MLDCLDERINGEKKKEKFTKGL